MGKADQDAEGDHTVFDLDVSEAAGKQPPGEPAAAAASTSDEDLLADLGFLDDEAPTVPEPSPVVPEKKKRVSSQVEKAKSDVDLAGAGGDLEGAMTEGNPRGTRAPLDEAESNPDVLNAIGSMPLEIVAVLGRKKVSVKEMSRMRAGSILEIDAEGERLVDLVAGGKTIGKGELVLVEGKLGVRIVKYF